MKLKTRTLSIDWQKILPIALSIGAAAFSALTSLLIARPLGKELYGEIQYYVGIIGSLTIIMPFGINYVLIKNSQFEKDQRSFFTKYLLLFNILNSLVLVGFVLVGYYILTRLSQNIFLILLIYFAGYATAFDVLLGGYLLGTRRAALSTALSSFLPKLFLFVSSLVVLYCFDEQKLVSWYVPIYLVSYALSGIPYAITLIRKTTFRFTRGQLLDVGTFFLLAITQGLNGYLSRVMQGQYDDFQLSHGGTSYNGVYGLSLQIVALSTLFGSVITNISQPTFAYYAAMGDHEGLIKEYRKVLRVNAYIGIPFGVALAVECRSLLSIFGETYNSNESMVFFILVSIAHLLSNITGPDGTLLTFAGHQKIQIINGILYTSSFLISAFIAMNLTIYGIPLAYLLSTLLVEIIKFVEFYVFYKVFPFDWKTSVFLLLIFICSVLIFAPINLIENVWLWASVNVLVGGGVISVLFFFTPFKDDRKFFRAQRIDKKTSNKESGDNNSVSPK